MFVSVLRVVIEGNVLAFLVELEIGRGGETQRERGLSGKLMRELAGFEHGQRVGAGCLGQSGVEG